MNLAVEYIKISDLVRYERNARTHSDDQISQVASSIREFGFTNPVLIDEENILIAGHGRLAAAISLAMESIPAIRLRGLSENKKKALRIADNQIALNASWGFDLLAEELAELNADSYYLSILAFDDEFLTGLLDGDLLDNDEDQQGYAETEDLPETSVIPASKNGDVWLLGEHRVMCGDSTSFDDVDKLLKGDLVDLLVTDPPYNVDYQGKTGDSLKIANDNLSDKAFRQFLRDAYSTADSVMKPGAVFYIWHSDSEGHNFRGAAHEVGWKIRQCLIWNKNTFVLGRQDYQWKHEPCLYGWKDGAAHYWCGDRNRPTILDFDKPARSGEHPTMKPVELIQTLIVNSSLAGNVILDLFGGSGSSLIACENTGRKARLMELDPRYVDVIVKRWQNHTGKQAILESNGRTFDATSEASANDEIYESKMRA